LAIFHFYMNDFILYISRPISINSYKKIKIGHILKLLLFYFFSILILGLISHLLCDKLGIIKDYQLNSNRSILIAVFLAPIYEEILLRSLLIFRNKYIHLFVIVSAIFAIFSMIERYAISAIIFFVLLLILLILIYIFSKKTIELFIKQYFIWFFYFSVFLFGFLHITIFSGDYFKIILIAPILVGPQIVLGFILGYIRMNYGLRYSILFHFMINSPLLLTLAHKIYLG